ncbi:winged helix DNA-binding protein [Candidatus Rhodobacter oscarellae]|uniref:winged helix DNA-binding protein n=1 Tax=Candidatus Rhodobacter oscarellae TaxID=1675527 RepID=UPI00128EB303|nr:winged helix DNA-binding protein [Candidatus Rhodobacter lobularis]
MIDKKDDTFLGTNLKGMMMTLLAQWNGYMDEGRAATEFAEIRQSDMRVFGQLRGRVMKLSDIHRELGFSRQAAQQAVDRLAGHGVLQVALAQGSRRDKVVSVTEKGQRLRTLAAVQIRQIEEGCADVIGEDGKEQLRALLVRLVEGQRRS